MNRTDRLYAVVEELRASAPRRRSARQLATRFEVSVRTIERDISALQQAGVPIYADAGRHGGYALDKTMALPPLNFTPAEAVAVAIALDQAGGSPFARSARTAMHKIVGAMSAADGAAARALAERIRMTRPVDTDLTGTDPTGTVPASTVPASAVKAGADPAAAVPAGVPAVVEEAVAARQVVRLAYVDRNGTVTERDVEPVAFVSGTRGWYFIGWCRLREEARGFRIDRIHRAALLDETAPPRQYEDVGPRIPDLVAHTLEIG